MKALTSKQEGERKAIVDELSVAAKSLRQELERVNGQIIGLNQAISDYNVLLEKAHEFRNEVAEEIESDWEDGEAPDSVQESWHEEWVSEYAESLTEIDPIDLDISLDQGEKLDALEGEA